ncbi:MAG: ABC transporter permease [Candidatus Izemoplasmatales bacterium]|nr:ABC transporter permease [Candidatus Izemoplasmatales bacterium]
MSFLEILYYLLPLVIASAVPLALVALGALFSERSGVVNIALEGIMLMGGFIGVVVIFFLEKTSLGYQTIALIGLLTGTVVGVLFSLLHAFAAINMKANQIISATALNMLAPAFAIFAWRTYYGVQQVTIEGSYRISDVPLLSQIPFIGDIFFHNAYLSTYVGVAIFLIAVFILYRTKQGLRLRSCGENPQAADSLGINIYKIRYAGVMVSGGLAGMGGVIFVLSFANEFNADVAGFGFLALAVLIFGNWKPGKIVLAALFFASMRVIANSYFVIPFLRTMNLSSDFYRMIPYIATLVVLAFVSKNSAAPKAAGEPYDAGKR